MNASAKRLAFFMAARVIAKSAVAALIFLEHELRRGTKPFGVVAPHTAKRATLEKYRGAQTGSVVHRHFLYVENNPVHTLYACRAIT